MDDVTTPILATPTSDYTGNIDTITDNINDDVYNSQINIVYYFHYIYIYYVCIQLYSLYLTPHSIILHMMYCICFIHYM